MQETISKTLRSLGDVFVGEEEEVLLQSSKGERLDVERLVTKYAPAEDAENEMDEDESGNYFVCDPIDRTKAFMHKTSLHNNNTKQYVIGLSYHNKKGEVFSACMAAPRC